MDSRSNIAAFWFYICDQCDCVGFWEPNMRLAIAQTRANGAGRDPAGLEKRIEQTSDGKLWIRKFIQFQQGNELTLRIPPTAESLNASTTTTWNHQSLF